MFHARNVPRVARGDDGRTKRKHMTGNEQHLDEQCTTPTRPFSDRSFLSPATTDPIYPPHVPTSMPPQSALAHSSPTQQPSLYHNCHPSPLHPHRAHLRLQICELLEPIPLVRVTSRRTGENDRLLYLRGVGGRRGGGGGGLQDVQQLTR